jgi:archaellum component FlaF (FlaF/FlaG flagellin family)
VGFSSIPMFILLFFAMIAAVSMFVLMQAKLVETTATAYAERDRLVEEMNTEITILNASYSNATETTSIYVQNTGKTKIEIELIDVYIDEFKVPRSDSNRSITFESSTMNPLHWDHDEVLRIEVYRALGNSTHLATISTQNKAKATKSY